MTRTIHRLLLTGLVALLTTPASAQTLVRTNAWTHGSTVSVFGGVARADSDTQPLVGTAIGWEVTPTISVEGSGYWFDRGADADAFAAALKVQAGLPVARPVVPFLAAGVGLYRASFDPASNTVPGFYRNRLNTIGAPAGSLRAFTDPSFIAGGGVNFFLNQHIAIRPDVEATLVRRNAHNYVVAVAAMHLAYHFEDHPIAPRRSVK